MDLVLLEGSLGGQFRGFLEKKMMDEVQKSVDKKARQKKTASYIILARYEAIPDRPIIPDRRPDRRSGTQNIHRYSPIGVKNIFGIGWTLPRPAEAGCE